MELNRLRELAGLNRLDEGIGDWFRTKKSKADTRKTGQFVKQADFTHLAKTSGIDSLLAFAFNKQQPTKFVLGITKDGKIGLEVSTREGEIFIFTPAVISNGKIQFKPIATFHDTNKMANVPHSSVDEVQKIIKSIMDYRKSEISDSEYEALAKIFGYAKWDDFVQHKREHEAEIQSKTNELVKLTPKQQQVVQKFVEENLM